MTSSDDTGNRVASSSPSPNLSEQTQVWDPVMLGHHPLAKIYAELGQALLARATSVGSHSPEGRRRIDEAVHAFRGALAEVPDDAELEFWLAQACEAQGNLDEALRFYLESARTDPTLCVPALPRVLRLLTPARSRSLAEALAWYGSPERSRLQGEIAAAAAIIDGYACLYRDEFPNAAAAFQKALGANPSSSELRQLIHEGYGDALRRDETVEGRRERLGKAVEQLQEALRVGAGDAQRTATSALWLAQVLNNLHQYDEALAAVTQGQALQAGPTAELALTRARSLLGRSELDAAESTIESVATGINSMSTQNSLRAEMLALRAGIAYARERCDEAIKLSDEALDAMPAYSSALKIGALARLTRAKDTDIDPAIRMLQTYARRLPIGGEETAETAIELIAIQPSDTRAVALKRLVEGDSTDINLAIHMLQAFARRRPGDADSIVADLYKLHNLAAWEIECVRLEALHAPEHEIANAHYEAGMAQYNNDQYAAACVHFETALDKNPGHQPTYWYLAESLLLQSYTNEAPYVEPTKIRAAKQVLTKGLAGLPLPSADKSWIYLTGARICEQEARVPENLELRMDSWWEGLTYIERALMHKPNSVKYLAMHARLCRNVDLEASALATTAKGIELAPDDVEMLGERAAICANTGQFAEAAVAIDKYHERQPDDWSDTIRVFIHYQLSEYEEAIKLIEPVLDKNPNNIWSRQIYASCLRLLDKDHETVSREYARVWEKRHDQNYSDERQTIGWAGYYLGAVTNGYDRAVLLEAHDIFQSFLDDLAYNQVDSFRALGLICLALGDVQKARRHFKRSHELPDAPYAIEEFRDKDIRDAKRAAIAWPAGERGVALLGKVEAKLDQQRANFRLATPQEELQQTLDKLQVAPDSWARTAAEAGLARLAGMPAKWMDALERYQRLLNDARFPEGHIGFQNSIEGLLADGDTHLRAGEAAQALTAFERVSAVLANPAADVKVLSRELPPRLALAAFALDDPAEMRRQIGIALQHEREQRSSRPGAAAAKRVRPLLRDVAQYWQLDDALCDWIVHHTSDAALSGELEDVRRTLRIYLNDAYKMPASASEITISVVTPIVFEVGDRLVPLVDSRQDGGHFLYELIPQMRQRIQDEIGIQVPGVRARRSGLADNRYSIQIDEVPLTNGIAHPQMWFAVVPELLNTSPGWSQALADIHPLTGASGIWVNREQAESYDANGQASVSAPQFLVYQIEALLRRNLVRFFGPQEAASLLQTWEKEEGGYELMTVALPNERARLRVTWLLRALAREYVPITNWRSLLAAIHKAGGVFAPLDHLVRAARLSLRDQLPANASDSVRIRLPEEYEQQLLGHMNGRPFFAASPQQKHEFLIWLREEMRLHKSGVALITGSYELRPILSRLVQPEFPTLIVLSQEELIEP